VTDYPSANRRYLALWFPFLPADAFGDTRKTPLVFIEKTANAMRLTAISPAALALGLSPGLTLADARARFPALAAVDRDHPAEAALLERIADGCDRYTPMVMIEPTDGLVLDISGCDHLFGGEEGLAGDLGERLVRFGIHVRLALGDTPDAARALARFFSDKRDILALPITALEADPETETALRRAGLKTIGDLAARPRAPLAARFGDLPTKLARLLGEEDRRITPRRPPPALIVARRFAEPIARIEDALATLGELVAEAAVDLEAKQLGGRRFAASFFRSNGMVRRLTVETGRPSRDPAALMRLFGERLDALRDPLDPGFGFDLIRLAIPTVEPLAPVQPSFEEDARSAEDVVALVDRLSTRMGAKRLRRALPHDSHVPERASAIATATKTTPSSWPRPQPGEPPFRPIHLFDPPQPIEVTAEVPDGAPVRFRWRAQAYHVIRAEGPERIAPEWWRRWRTEGLTRDYYRVEDDAGHRFWLFRAGLYGEEAQHPRWYMHGLFA
jgi:protein ImuB